MAASSSDLFMEVGDPGTATTLSAPGYTIGGTSLTVGSTANWPTTTGVIFAMDEVETVDGVETEVEGSYNEYAGVVASGTSITGVTHVRGTDQNFAAGTSTRVYIPVSAERENRIAQGMVAEHNQDGTHGAITSTGATLTNPKVITGINDTNGNELFKVTATGSAVNEVTVANAATGNNPTLTASGGDTNIQLSLKGKGTSGVGLELRTQNDNANSITSATTAGVRVQLGWGQINGNGTATLSETVTFPTAFTTVYGASISLLGSSTGAASDITGVTTNFTGGSVAVQAAADTITTTNFRATVARNTGTFGAGTYYAYSWIAWGV